MKFNIEPTKASEFDFTKLDNYIKLENTLEGENKDWLSAKSRFYTLYDHTIASNSCRRDSPDQIEIKVVCRKFSDEDWDVLHTACGDLLELSDEDRDILKPFGDFVWFRHNSIVHRRGQYGIAIVLDNNLYFIS